MCSSQLSQKGNPKIAPDQRISESPESPHNKRSRDCLGGTNECLQSLGHHQNCQLCLSVSPHLLPLFCSLWDDSNGCAVWTRQGSFALGLAAAVICPLTSIFPHLLSAPSLLVTCALYPATASSPDISIDCGPFRKSAFEQPPFTMARVYADVNERMPRSYWDYDSVNISWGVLENYEVVRKIGKLFRTLRLVLHRRIAGMQNTVGLQCETNANGVD